MVPRDKAFYRKGDFVTFDSPVRTEIEPRRLELPSLDPIKRRLLDLEKKIAATRDAIRLRRSRAP